MFSGQRALYPSVAELPARPVAPPGGDHGRAVPSAVAPRRTQRLAAAVAAAAARSSGRAFQSEREARSVCAPRHRCLIAALSPPRSNAVRWQSMNLATRLGSLLKYVLPFSPVLPYPSRFLFRRFYPCFWGGGGGTLPAAPPRGGFEAGDGSARTPMRGGRGRALARAADEGRCMLRAQECLSASSLLTNAHALALWTAVIMGREFALACQVTPH